MGITENVLTERNGLELKEVVSNSYRRMELCVLLLRSEQPMVCIHFVGSEIWLVIASYDLRGANT
jgi:hypothetical protein